MTIEFTQEHWDMTIDQWLKAIEEEPELINLMMAYYQLPNPQRKDGKWEWELYLEVDPTIEIPREEWGPDYEHPRGIWLNDNGEIPTNETGWLNS